MNSVRGTNAEPEEFNPYKSFISIGCFLKSMNLYYVQRITMVIPTLVGITMVTFILLKMLPGDPVQSLAGERTDPAAMEVIARELGDTGSVIDQYLGYVKLLMQGELGRSYYTNTKVSDELLEKLPNTLCLAGAALLVSVVVGLLFGVLMAAYRGSFIDRCCLIVVTGGISIPVFWLGLLLVYIFCFWLKLLPPAGMEKGNLAYYILPASTLGLNAAAALARITRASMIDILSQPYILTARAKGISRLAIVLHHAFRNALLPVVTIIGLDFGSFLNGSFLTETIFGWDGMGRYAIEAIFRRDYPVVLGCVLTGAILFVGVNLMVDLIYRLCDPKIRYAHTP